MTNYDNFNPTIPETEEVDNIDNLPPAPKVVDAGQKTKRGKTERVVRKKPAPKPAESRKERVSFSVAVKQWAGSQTVRWVTGLFLGFSGIYLGVSFLSYFATCMSDQAEIINSAVGYAGQIENKGGEGGARISDFLINKCFGLGSLVIVSWLFAMALKLLVGKPRFKSVDFTIKSVVALITVSLIIGLLTIGLSSPVNWGGYHGRYVNEFVIHFLGWTGAVILCLFMISLFVVICMRDLICWIIRIRRQRAERRRKAAEKEEAERQAREREMEEMRKFEEAEALRREEEMQPERTESTGEPTHVTFSDEETGLYSSLPDFEEDIPQRHLDVVPTDTARGESSDGLTAAQTEYVLPQDETEQSGDTASANEIRNASTLDESEASSPETAINDPAMVVNVNNIAQINTSRESSESVLPGMHPYKFPPAEILREGSDHIAVDAAEQMDNKEQIKKTLLDFGIPIVSIEATVGPTVTLYEIVPDRGVKINRIRNLGDDIALSLKAEGVRIIAPIPGKGTIGIEVANNDPQTVSMRTIIKSRKYQESKYKLPIAMGSTISNEVYIADLAKMPHLLVAGATGQGKSVGLNAIIASLLYRKTPDELKFVMIDPKMVEFSLYAKIEAHYLAKIPDAEDAIITDMEKVVATLSSLCVEMDDRYQLLKAAHTRNIEEYNDKIKARSLNPAEGHRFLPYIVVVVDEFSDLIMTAGKEVEIPIARLAQKARAVGMHVIIATQRPSTNVITGIIKANFPARIAFKVSSGVDSKTILDTTGAQQLIGRGDMLISNNAPMVRVQCAFIDTPEVEAICDYIERQPYGQGAYRLPEPVVSGSGDSDSEPGNNFGDKDPLFDEVARLIVSSNTASTSSLQRRYSIGYNRAGKIMDQLEAAGIVGPAHGGKPRSVLVDAITLESILNP